MSQPPLIRLLTPSDAKACAALRREMLADAPWAFAASENADPGVDVEAVAKRLADPSHASIGAFGASGSLLGVASVRRDHHAKMAHRAKVWGVYVTPAARGSGVARAIMLRTLDVARSWPGVTSVGLSCSERAVAARKIYESVGFRAWGREPKALVADGVAYDEFHLVCEFNTEAALTPWLSYAPV